MSRSRIINRFALSKTIQLLGFKREAARLNEEVMRLRERIEQVQGLERSYREHLALPSLSMLEYRSVMDISRRLGERKTIDQARLELLDVERVHLAKLLAGKQQQIDLLDDEAKRAKQTERQEKEDRQELLMPARRSH